MVHVLKGKSTLSESLANFKLYFFCFCILVIALTGSNAQKKCDLFQWKCKNGECINSEDRCDGKVTCSDLSDETQELCAGVICPQFTTKCKYGACVNGNAKCDGVKDCADNSDEENCESLHKIPNKFQCRSGEFIGSEQVCDGKQDCKDSSDETKELCSGVVCQAFVYKCKYGACVNGNARCNGVTECADRSDEESCPPRQTPAPIPQPPDVITPPISITTPEPDGKSCPAILDDPNISAVHAYNNSTIVNYGEIISEFQEIIYRCRPKHVLYGERSNQCLSGQWRYPIPKCSKVCPSGVINGVTFSSKCKLAGSETSCHGLIQPKTRVDISCAVGYRKPLRDVPEIIQCTETGEWDYHPASCEPECGKLTISATPFVNGGEKVNITTVPWHTAIYKTLDDGRHEHICGGTIFSAKLVISAAHCFWDVRKERAEDRRLFTVGVGKVFRSYDAFEPLFIQFFNLSKIHIPVSYGGAGRSYENDIAMLVLNKHILYRDHIKPICIRWFKYADREVKPGTIGRIAGWGKINSKNEFGEDLKAVDLPAFSKEQCLRNNVTYSTFITGEKFCVGAPDDESVCEGDSGGGYVVKNQDTGTDTYYLSGVLSVGLGLTCERDHLTTFTNIQYHKDMITDYEIEYRPR